MILFPFFHPELNTRTSTALTFTFEERKAGGTKLYSLSPPTHKRVALFNRSGPTE